MGASLERSSFLVQEGSRNTADSANAVIVVDGVGEGGASYHQEVLAKVC